MRCALPSSLHIKFRSVDFTLQVNSSTHPPHQTLAFPLDMRPHSHVNLSFSFKLIRGTLFTLYDSPIDSHHILECGHHTSSCIPHLGSCFPPFTSCISCFNSRFPLLNSHLPLVTHAIILGMRWKHLIWTWKHQTLGWNVP
jgi:hypothetical protein